MRIHPLLIGSLAAVAVSVAAIAADRARPAAPVAASPVPLMWKVSDADNDLYLLGSFHMLRPGDYPLSKDVDAAFDDAEALLHAGWVVD